MSSLSRLDCKSFMICLNCSKSYPGLMWFATFAAIATGLIASPADSKKFEAPPMPAGYDDPGPEPQNLLEKIVGGLRSHLKDPYSILDFSLCRSRVMTPTPALSPTLAWRRAYRVTQFTLNAKNSFGGYTGLQAGIATFEDGMLTRISLIGPPIQKEPAKSTREPCQPIPNEKIQELLGTPR